ncbi:MAG: regulatory iron-sulfur-containing complex subunit RicT [Spirochaetales bacterium]|nr:regulatory iron-sulfur-containing complex subunit RicT [Spirochaetales bacterium]
MEYCVLPEDYEAGAGDYVIMHTRYGKDLVQLLGEVKDIVTVSADSLRKVERIATPEDLEKRESYEEREKEAFSICKEKISKHSLDMKLVTAHYLLEESKVMFFFTADNRIDFRELVKDLVSVFRMRIELRQIGVRDEARFLGGMAVCGRSFCCHGIMDYLKPVSIKMAKEQNLSLNSLKISGPCGRLLCCLSYEYDYYDEEKKCYPPEGYKFKIKDVNLRISDINIFSRKISLSGPEGLRLELDQKDFKKRDDGRWIINKKLEI